MKCPPEQSWKCSLALIIVRSWCLVFLSMNSHSSPQLEQIIAYTRFLVLYDISCITVKVRPFLNVNEAPSIKLGHVDTFLNRWWWFMKIKFWWWQEAFQIFRLPFSVYNLLFCNKFFIRSLLFKLNSICFIKWKIL